STMKILVTGKNGQLGKSINKMIVNNKQDNEFVFVGREELDQSKKNSITSYFENNNFDIIVNCAAYTAVDKAEEEKELADQVNHLAVAQLAEIANKQQAKLIHISTDYVFDGESIEPYLESDPTRPINTYGKTKLAGEKAVLNLMSRNAVIIRTSWVYSEYGNNFIHTILKLGKDRDKLSIVDDQVGSPTYAGDLAKVIINILQNEKFINTELMTQVYHYSNLGECSWYKFTKEIFELSDTKCTIYPITTKQYPTPAKRPMFTVLNKNKIIKKFDINIPKWEDSLGRYIKTLR
ncbi:MAG: dTDP-4-dehydrorhamnose reductase, partial [Candidatus Thioglobus sp.]